MIEVIIRSQPNEPRELTRPPWQVPGILVVAGRVVGSIKRKHTEERFPPNVLVLEHYND